MARLKEDPVREERIIYEIVVDAYGEEERAMGWYYYAENEMQFPFRARCHAADESSPLRKGEEVEVVGLPSEQTCLSELRVRVRWQGRTMAVPLSQLKALDADEKTDEVIEDWHYWTRRGYRFSARLYTSMRHSRGPVVGPQRRRAAV
jgi:hypothetical protein